MIFGFPDIDLELLHQQLESGMPVTFLLSLDGFSDIVSSNIQSLNDSEKTRAGKFQYASDRQSFVMGRLLLRSILESYLHGNSYELNVGAHGKPYCTHASAPNFNISHGGGWLGACFCKTDHVGIDLENLERHVPFLKLAARYYTQEEQVLVQREGKEAFLRIWTRKEAIVKAMGQGITRDLSSIDTLSKEWCFHNLQPDQNVIGVVAHRFPPLEHVLFMR